MFPFLPYIVQQFVKTTFINEEWTEFVRLFYFSLFILAFLYNYFHLLSCNTFSLISRNASLQCYILSVLGHKYLLILITRNIYFNIWLSWKHKYMILNWKVTFGVELHLLPFSSQNLGIDIPSHFGSICPQGRFHYFDSRVGRNQPYFVLHLPPDRSLPPSW